jgi:zinc protease
MHIRLTFPLLSLLFIPFVSQAAPAKLAWPHDGSDLKPDPAAVYGRLPNGVGYILLPNAEPPKKVSVRLYVNAGSLMEEDSQQGLAHFLEHMAFNGTKNYKADEMKSYFERLGMSFGGDTNAHTSFKETVYDADLPEGTPAMVDESIKLLLDYASGMLLGAEEIEKERGVILSEKLARDTVQYRTMIEGFKFSLPESLIPQRLPIGTEDVIKTAPRERFTSFYSKWYTPDRLTVIAVGDIKPAEMETKIKAAFKDLKPAPQTLADPNLGKITLGKGLQTKLHTEKEAGETTISIETARPSRRLADSNQTRFENLLRGLAENMINRRFERISRQANAPFLGAEYGHEDFLDFVESDSIQLQCKPEQWEAALNTGEQELRRAIQFGFSEAEFTQAKANLVEAMENAAKQAPTRQSKVLANELQKSLAEGIVFTHPASDLARVKESLGKATAAKCHELIKSAWATEDVRVFAGGNLALEDGDAKIKEAFLKSRKTEVTAPKEEVQGAFAYTDFGPAGTVIKREEHKDLGITLVTFSNNVRLNLKPTDFKKDTVAVNANFGAGKLVLPKDKPGMALFADSVFDAGALEKHSSDDLERILAGRTVGASFGIGDEFLSLSGQTNQKDLLLECQLLCAQMMAPGYREEGLRQLMLGLDTIYAQVERTPEGILKTKVDGLLHNEDPRFTFPSKAEISARTIEELKTWLKEMLSSSYLEVSMVGDFDVETAIKNAASTFGALPTRAATRPDYAAERAVQRADVMEKTISFESKIPKGVVAVYWPTTDRRNDIKVSRRLNIVSAILDDMVLEKVREELGESYSPDVHSLMSDTFTGDGQISAYLVCEGTTADKIGGIVKTIGAKLAASGATADQLERARKPLLTMMETQKRNNLWWIKTIVSEAQTSPARLDWARTITDDYKAITLEEVNALAAKYLVAEKASVVRIVPAAPKAEK